MNERTDLEELKGAVAEALESVLDKIDRCGREPDAWERAHLVTAISLLFRGAYSLAGLQTADAAASPERRSPDPHLPDLPPYGTKLLRLALAEAVAEPLREWPHFGPIVLAQTPQC